MIQFEDISFRKVKLKATLDGIFMTVLNFDWLVCHEIMTREIRKVKKEQNQKRECSWLQTKQQKSMTVLRPQCDFRLFSMVDWQKTPLSFWNTSPFVKLFHEILPIPIYDRHLIWIPLWSTWLLGKLTIESWAFFVTLRSFHPCLLYVETDAKKVDIRKNPCL